MNFRLEELSSRTGGLAWGKALRLVGGFAKMDAGAIRGIRKKALAWAQGIWYNDNATTHEGLRIA